MRPERLAAIQRRVDLVKSAFPTLIAVYDDKAPFTRSGQREYHQRTIAARRAAGSVAAALASDRLSNCFMRLYSAGASARADRAF